MELTLFEMLFTAALGFALGWGVAHVFAWPLARGLAGLLLAVMAGTLMGIRPDVAAVGGLMIATGFAFHRWWARA